MEFPFRSGGSIEVIRRSAEEFCFEWRIGDFLSLDLSLDFFSPSILAHDAEWRMLLWNNCERLQLSLLKFPGGSPLTLNMSAGLRGPRGVQHKTEREGEVPTGRYVGQVWQGESSPQLADVRRTLLQQDGSFVVWCEMKVPARDPCPQIPSEATDEGVASSEKRGTKRKFVVSPVRDTPDEEVQSLKDEIKTLQQRLKDHELEEENHKKLADGQKKLADRQKKLADEHKKLADEHKKISNGHKKIAEEHRKTADEHKNMADVYRCQLEEKMTLLSRLEKGQQSFVQCVVCLENLVDSVLYRCGHMCMCYRCAFQLQTRNSRCPICRCDIQDVIKFYT